MKQIFQFIIAVGYASKESIVFAPYPSNLPMEFVTDLSWLKQCLCTLVENSENGIVFSVKVIVVDGKDFIEFTIKDRGKRLSKEALRDMFNPPIQSERGSVGSLGLGCLAIRVKTLGGKYDARSRDDGKGNLYSFFLPLPSGNSIRKINSIDAFDSDVNYRIGKKPSIDSNSSRSKGGSFKSTEMLKLGSSVLSHLAQKKIMFGNCDTILAGLSLLIVDDSVTIRKMAAIILKRGGAIVSLAKDGREACDMTENILFDMIIMDIEMPILNGFLAAREMRDQERLSGEYAKVIVYCVSILMFFFHFLFQNYFIECIYVYLCTFF